MTPQILTTAQELDNAPVGTVVLDSIGTAYQKVSRTEFHDGTVKSHWHNATECDTQDSGIMEELGEYSVIYTPEQTAEPYEPYEPYEPSQREYTTDEELVKLNDVPIGTIVEDKEGDEWVKARNGWALETACTTRLRAAYVPYTIVHTPPSNLANL